MGAIGAVILEDEHGFAVEQPLAALGRVDLHAFDIELDDEALASHHDALLQKTVERNHLDAFARAAAVGFLDPERLVLGAAEPHLVAGRRPDGAVQNFGTGCR